MHVSVSLSANVKEETTLELANSIAVFAITVSLNSMIRTFEDGDLDFKVFQMYIDYSHVTSAQAHEVLRIYLHKLCA